ncbi:MAG: hypothetical protein ABJA87_05745 [bacterium]
MFSEADDEGPRRRGHGEGFGPRGGGPRGRGGFGRGRGPGGTGGFGRPGGWQQADLPSADDAAAWFAGRLPSTWFTKSPTVSVDREEILVIGELAAPTVASAEVSDGQGDTTHSADDAGDDAGDDTGDDTARRAAAAGRISRFREETREERIAIAVEAEARYGRKVAWGASIGDTRVLFTHLAVPVMTRLRQPERHVLDTLVDAGVARSRSEALAWSVKLVGQHTDTWLAGLRDAMSEVDKLRTEGPQL